MSCSCAQVTQSRVAPELDEDDDEDDEDDDEDDDEELLAPEPLEDEDVVSPAPPQPIIKRQMSIESAAWVKGCFIRGFVFVVDIRPCYLYAFAGQRPV